MVSSASVTSMASVTSKASTASVTTKVNLSFEVFIEVLYSSNKIDIFLELRPQMTSEARSKVIRPT